MAVLLQQTAARRAAASSIVSDTFGGERPHTGISDFLMTANSRRVRRIRCQASTRC